MFYLTCAIDYANGDPHLGHALEKIGADTIARYHRLRGEEVHFLIGMDEHGQKVAQAAAAEGVPPQVLVDRVAERFQAMWERLRISHDQFIRTTTTEHKVGVRALIQEIFTRNPDDFYEKSYAGWYCVGCEAFKTEGEIVDQRCILHPTRTLEWVEERNWFFRLSRYRDFLREHVLAQPTFVGPESRRNEILALLDQGLEDVSASRARLTWGVPFPRPTGDGEPQTTYVWFDALPNYLTAAGYPNDGYGARWPAQLHVVGKDITRFHCLIWPALLHSAGLPLPGRVWAHGFVTLAGGERFSKSAGVRVELAEAVERYGPDAFRYFMLREVPFDGDGAFSWGRFADRYTADLANAFGNLLSRSVAMVERYCGGVVPTGVHNSVDDADRVDYTRYRDAMGGERGFLLHEALRAVWDTVARGNEYVDREAPWRLAKDPARRRDLEHVLASLIRQLARQAIHIAPFMPERAEEVWRQLGGPGSVHAQRLGPDVAPDPTGWHVVRGEPLFPKEQTAGVSD